MSFSDNNWLVCCKEPSLLSVKLPHHTSPPFFECISMCYGDFHVILIYPKWASPLPILLVQSNHSTIVRNFHLNLQLYSYICCNFILISNFPVQTRIHKRSHKQKQPSHENKLKHFITFHYVSELPSWMFSV